jgi:hypothetical protein
MFGHIALTVNISTRRPCRYDCGKTIDDEGNREILNILDSFVHNVNVCGHFPFCSACFCF